MKIIHLPTRLLKQFNTLTLMTVCFGLLGCATFKQEELNSNTELKSNSAVLLVGLVGQRKVDYLQLCHSSIPCLNYRFPATTNDVIAMPMETGLSNLHLSTVTYGDHPAFYDPWGNSNGYFGVDSKKIDITNTGVTYYMTLNTDTRQTSYQIEPQLIQIAKNKYGSKLMSLPARNFSWH